MMRFLAGIHLLGNALLLWLGYYWLGIGETRAATLLWSALVAVVLLALACWLHGATLVYFGRAGSSPRGTSVPQAFRAGLRRVALLMAAVLVVLALYLLLARWAAYSAQPAFKIASYLTMTFRKPVKPSTVLAIFNVVLWLVRWMVVPALALPIIARIATREAGRATKPLYWVEVPLLLVCALWVPLKLTGWVPHAGGFAMEMLSFILRALVGYLLFVGAWLVLEYLTSGGKPRTTQPSTVVSP